MKYKIVMGMSSDQCDWASAYKSLEYQVNVALKDGWQLIGGVTVCPNDGYFERRSVSQSMFKKTKGPTNEL
jgi:hypothetical protein